MDDQLVRELIELQREENALLKKYLWRIRFSLLSLLVLTTAIGIGLGFLIYGRQNPVAVPPTATTVPVTWSAPPGQGPYRLKAILDTSTWQSGTLSAPPEDAYKAPPSVLK
jgi:hypothetical protein